jgi:hypothetical protein
MVVRTAIVPFSVDPLTVLQDVRLLYVWTSSCSSYGAQTTSHGHCELDCDRLRDEKQAFMEGGGE